LEGAVVTNLVNIKAGQDRHARLDQKLRRELGECVLRLLADDRTEDICLNPDSTLWAKRMNQPFEIAGEMSASQARPRWEPSPP
jgi:Flp pilus assembly CpaF family ATPase